MKEAGRGPKIGAAGITAAANFQEVDARQGALLLETYVGGPAAANAAKDALFTKHPAERDAVIHVKATDHAILERDNLLLLILHHPSTIPTKTWTTMH